jgi:hypothetical protein
MRQHLRRRQPLARVLCVCPRATDVQLVSVQLTRTVDQSSGTCSMTQQSGVRRLRRRQPLARVLRAGWCVAMAAAQRACSAQTCATRGTTLSARRRRWHWQKEGRRRRARAATTLSSSSLATAHLGHELGDEVLGALRHKVQPVQRHVHGADALHHLGSENKAFFDVIIVECTGDANAKE